MQLPNSSYGWNYTEPVRRSLLANIMKRRHVISPDYLWSRATGGCTTASYKTYVTSTSLEDCKQKCLDRTDFVCRSLDFRSMDLKCFMREHNSSSENYALHYTYPCSSSISYGYVYLERTPVTECEYFKHSLVKTPWWLSRWQIADSHWTVVVSGCLTLGTENELFQVATFDECQEACQISWSFECASFTYHKGQCRLSSKNKTTAADSYSEPCTGETAALYSEAYFISELIKIL